MIVESFVSVPVPPKAHTPEPSIVVLSARSDERLRAYVSATIEFLERADQEGMTAEDFAHFAYSSQVGRVPFRHRLAIVATNKQGFIEKARAYLTREAAPDVFVGNKRSADALAGVLTGDEARDFTAALIKSRQWNKIASIWACGGAIDWASVHAGAARRRLSFPSYPFENIHCDIRAAIASSVEAAKRGRERAAAAIGALGHDDVHDVKTEWFHLAPGLLGDAMLPADFNDIEAGGEWAKQYWLDHLSETTDTHRSLTPLLALDRSEPATTEPAIQSVSDVLNGTLIESLQRCTQTHQVEVETLIVAAWAILVNRYTKARCSQFGVSRALTPIQKLKAALRLGAGGAESQADFTEYLRNLVPVRICTVMREKISQWLEHLQRNLNRKHVYGHIPLQQIEGWVGVENLFDSVIVFQKTSRPWSDATPAADQTSQQLLAAEIFASQPRVVIDLTVTIHLDAVELDVLYRSGGPAREKVQTLLEHFEVLLEGLAANPHRNPAALQMRTKTESRETFWKTLERVNPSGGVQQGVQP